MTDRMTHTAKVGDLAVTVKYAGRAGREYRLRRVAQVSPDGWVESTRALDGTDERRRTSSESLWLLVLRPDAVDAAARAIAHAANLAAVQTILRQYRDEGAYDELDRRTDFSRVDDGRRAANG
jgi:hypothetical protein